MKINGLKSFRVEKVFYVKNIENVLGRQLRLKGLQNSSLDKIFSDTNIH